MLDTEPVHDQGVLIIGSSFMSHSVGYLQDWSSHAAPKTIVDGYFMGFSKRSILVS